ncbi:MAG: hypothetical protein KDN22_10505 [Verrucomicrobiae bacterium]|nr:hypothetical protein [Verrucomicrobiae bacterium]
MKNHFVWMLIGCTLPLLLIFLLPAFGVGDNVTLILFIVLMFGCHLFMGHHHHAGSDEDDEGTGSHDHH